MLSCARVILSGLNTIILLSAVSQILLAEDLKQQSSQSVCSHENASSLLYMGIFFLMTTVFGILGSCCNVKALQNIYLWVLLISTTATIVFSTFIFALMPRQSAYHIYQQTAADGFWLQHYRPALQRAVVNHKDWFGVKSCYMETNICAVAKNQTDHRTFRYIETGCCRPPNRCGQSMDEECMMWSRAGGECFDCDSCKAAYLANYQEQWDTGIVGQIARVLLLIATSALAFYAFSDDDRHDSRHQNGRKHARI